jgi:hypothetical protein
MEFLEATDLLKRRASRDYSPDQHLQTLPEYRKAQPVVRGAGKTCFELFEAYVKAVKIRPSTVNRWRTIFINIESFSNDEVQRWAASLVGIPMKPDADSDLKPDSVPI